MKFYLSKKHRLKRKKWIQKLFAIGKVYKKHPLLCYCLSWKDITNDQLLVSVPKKHIHSAVLRNKIKRRIRELYRLSPCRVVINNKRRHYLWGIVFTGTSIEDGSYGVLNTAFEQLIANIREKNHFFS